MRTKTTGNVTDRKSKDWREWQNVKKQRNDELIRQVELNNVTKVRELINRSLQGDLVADVNALGPNEMTPLHLACKMGQHEVAAVLLGCEADLECRNKACKTPLHYACQYNRYHIVKMLLTNKANYLSRDINDNTPLHLSVEMGQRESTEYMLSRFGYKQLKMKNKLGKQPHDLADNKLFPLFQEYEAAVMNKMQVYDIKEETVKKMFNNPKQDINNKQDTNLNLDKRIHKILDSIRSKKEPIPTPEQTKKDSQRSTSSNSNSNSNQNKSLERDSHNFERSTTDTLQSTSRIDSNTSLKQKKDNQYSNTSTSQTNISTEKSVERDRDSQDNKNLSDKFKAKRNIINCANKVEQKDIDNRPYSAPLKKYISNTDRSGKEKSDQQQQLQKKQEEENQGKQGSNTPRDPQRMTNMSNGFESPMHNMHNQNSIEVSKNEDTEFYNKKIIPEDFMAHMVLGKGSFGEVQLVQKKGQEGFQAMKVLRKQKIMGRNLTRQAKTERNILTYVQHPFIVELFQAFQTSEKLFLIMEQCPCGDLGQILHKLKKFDENTAKFYIAEILLAIEHLHSYNIIQRDLKPDNVVLDKQGHAKLTDFGLSKEEIDDQAQTSSFCGSVAQLAPEMLNKSGHGKSVDWYLLGVLLYEMLNGIPPYFDQDRDKMFEKIKTQKLKYHSSLSPQAIDILKQLLERNPVKRLGSQGDGEEIRKHPFFEGIDWNYVHHKKYKPPLMINKKVNLNKNPVEVTNKDPNCKDNYVDGWSFINPSVD